MSNPQVQQQLNPEEPTVQNSPQKTEQEVAMNLKASPSILHQRCVCQLCTCGKHHCPKPRVKGIFETSYQDHYKQFKYDLQNNPNMKQYHYEMRHYNPDQLKSNYQENYIKKQAPQVATEAFYPEMLPKRYVPFIDETEYKKNFHDFEIDKAVSMPNRFQNVAKNMILSPPVKFNGSTSYNQHYKGYAYDKQPQPNIEYTTEFVRSPIKFEGVSSYKSNYVPPPKVESKPVQLEYHHVSIPFKGESTYKNHFVGYKVDVPQTTPTTPMINGTPVKFEGKTAYQQYYDGKNIPRPEEHRRDVCICDMINIPTVNYQDKPHLRYDVSRNQWV